MSMGEAANVRAIRALTELKNALGRFVGTAQEALVATEIEISRTQEWLREREAHWRSEVEEAREAYEACLDEEGSNCAAKKAALRQAETELHKVRYWRAQVEWAVSEYRRYANRLKQLATTHTQRAQALLERKREELEAYIAVSIPAVASVPAGNAEARAPHGYSPPVIKVFDKSQILTNEDVAKYLSTDLPKEHIGVGRIKEINYTNRYVGDEKEYVAGRCITDEDGISRIDINRQSPKGSYDAEEMKRTIAHEVGHNVYWNLPEEQREEWNEISTHCDEFVNDVAARNEREDFAESYMFYIHAPEHLAKIQAKYDFMRQYIFKGREYR